jgi:hypothetical protein
MKLVWRSTSASSAPGPQTAWQGACGLCTMLAGKALILQLLILPVDYWIQTWPWLWHVLAITDCFCPKVCEHNNRSACMMSSASCLAYCTLRQFKGCSVASGHQTAAADVSGSVFCHDRHVAVTGGITLRYVPVSLCGTCAQHQHGM